MTKHVMLDLETWGTRPGCDIRSIGAVVFDPVKGDVSTPCKTCKGGTTRGNINEGGDCSDCMNTRLERGYGDTFYRATDNPVPKWYTGKFPESNRKYPLIRERETVQWWNEQSKEAQAAFANPVDLLQALQEFSVWLRHSDPNYVNGGNYPDIAIWANDPHFDCSILAAVYHALGLPVPWHYRAPRSMKTACELAGMTSADYSSYGTDHNALDDAIAQAMSVCEAYKRLGLRK